MHSTSTALPIKARLNVRTVPVSLARSPLLILVLLTTTSLSAGTVTIWDDVESHEWIAENWDNTQTVIHNADFQGRRALNIVVSPSASGYGILRTKQFLYENWEPSVVAMLADVWILGAQPVRLKLELRGAEFDSLKYSVTSDPTSPGSWQQVTWPLPSAADLSIIGSISIVVEDAATGAELYLDNLRLQTADDSEQAWDAMDGARNWFYFGNWHDWSTVPFPDFPGLEPVSSQDGCPESSTASLYLQWQYRGDPELTTAEVGTNNNENGLNLDLSDTARIGVCVKASSDQVPIRVFFFDQEGEVGFQTPSVFLRKANAWQEVAWAIPWPPGFDRRDVDEIKLIVGNLNEPALMSGWARFDRLRFFDAEPVADPPGLATVITNYDEQHPANTHLGGNFGALNSAGEAERVTLRLVTEDEVNPAESQAVLGVGFSDLVDDTFAGFFTSLLGSTSSPEISLDVRPWQYLTFDVRGSGMTNHVYNLKVELKEARSDDRSFEHTAYTYVAVDDAATNWTTVVLPLDFGDVSAWSLNRFKPDRTRMKELVLLLESHFNPASGSFFIDNLELIDTDRLLPPIDPGSSDIEVLSYFLETNFNYFRHARHPTTGLTLDRLAFSDLATVAGGGFALTAWCLGAEIGLLTRQRAYEYVEQALTTYLSAPMGQAVPEGDPIPSQGQIGVNGFYYHFLDARDAERKGDSELSSVDTTLLLFGVITSRQAITEANGYTLEQEMRITDLADDILERVDWPFFLDPASGRVYLGWKPEKGPDYTQPHWSGVGYVSSRDDCVPTASDDCLFTWDWTTDEIALIALAGMAAPDPALRLSRSIFGSWRRELDAFAGHKVTTTFPGTAFTYQFANLWLPLADLGIDILGLDWWANAREGLAANFAFSSMPDSAPSLFPNTFDGISFGLTACEDPSTRYRAFGTPPAGECRAMPDDEATIACFLEVDPARPDLVNGTLAPYGAAATIDYLPAESIAALRHAYFDLELWNNLFGFPDCFNRDMATMVAREAGDEDPALDCDPSDTGCDLSPRDRLNTFSGDEWFNPVQFSIDQGPIVLALGNYLYDGVIRDWVTSYPEMERALADAFQPSALRVPGFEVEVDDPEGPTTFFAVRNTTDDEVEIAVDYHGQQIADAPLRTDSFILGPGQTLTQNVRNDLSDLNVSQGFATGQIVIATSAGDATALEGDYFQIDSGNDFASGARLVRSERFCTQQEIRFVDFGSGSRLQILLKEPRGAAVRSFSYKAYNEAGTRIAESDIFTSEHLTTIDVADLVLGQSFGTLVFDFSHAGGGFVTARYSAFGRFSVELDGACRAPIRHLVQADSQLVVPGFEVEVDDPEGPTTFFAVRNTTDDPVEIAVAYHDGMITDKPLRTDLFDLEPQETLTRNVRSDLSGLSVSDGIAAGLIVITDTEGRTSRLEGDYFQIDSGNDFATGDRLVRSEDLCAQQEIRFVDFGSGSRLKILLEEPQGDAGPSFSYTATNEAGTQIVKEKVFTSEHLTTIDVEDLVPGQRFGNLVFDFSSAGGGFVTARYSAFGRFSVELDGGCAVSSEQ